jgi:hypothetical protein
MPIASPARRSTAIARTGVDHCEPVLLSDAADGLEVPMGADHLVGYSMGRTALSVDRLVGENPGEARRRALIASLRPPAGGLGIIGVLIAALASLFSTSSPRARASADRLNWRRASTRNDVSIASRRRLQREFCLACRSPLADTTGPKIRACRSPRGECIRDPRRLVCRSPRWRVRLASICRCADRLVGYQESPLAPIASMAPSVADAAAHLHRSPRRVTRASITSLRWEHCGGVGCRSPRW